MVFVALYDIRNAVKFKRFIESVRSRSQHSVIDNGTQKTHCEAAWKETLTCLFLSPTDFLNLFGDSAKEIMTHTEGMFCVSVIEAFAGCRDVLSSPFINRARTPLQTKLRGILSRFGDIKAFHTLKGSRDNHSQWFIIEYFDIRVAEAAWEGVNGHIIDNMKFQLALRDGLLNESGRPRDTRSEETAHDHTEVDHAAEPKTPKTATYLSQSPASSTRNLVLDDTSPTPYRFSHVRSGADDPDSAFALHRHGVPLSEHTPPTLPSPVDLRRSIANTVGHSHARSGATMTSRAGRRASNNVPFDVPREPYKPVQADHVSPAMNTGGRERTVVEEIPGPITNLYSSSNPSTQPQCGHDYFGQSDPYITDASMRPSWISSSSHSAIPMQYPLPPQSPMSSMCWDASTGNWFAWPSCHPLAEQWAYPPPTMFHPGLPLSAVHYPYSQQLSPHVQMPSYGHPWNQLPIPTLPPTSRSPPENNQLDIQKIEQGLDTRTTVMIKNIPNKMTDKELTNFINDVCPRRIDFLYLRMDFQNGCNVGYAFVNFINVQDLLRFAKMKLNQRWNLYSSEKVLQMSYANYQGKEALVEKFKNSCIMDEREEWRPKIFYSEPGPMQGLPEEFPKPTHMRRKERSSFNRGALFVPGTSAHQRTFFNANTTRNSSHVDGRRLRFTHDGTCNSRIDATRP